jgi:hypothetical protein
LISLPISPTLLQQQQQQQHQHKKKKKPTKSNPNQNIQQQTNKLTNNTIKYLWTLLDIKSPPPTSHAAGCQLITAITANIKNPPK